MNDLRPEDIPVPQKQSRHLLVIAGAAFILGLVLFIGAVWVSLHRSAPWDPLGAYPEQIVKSRVQGVDGPAVRVNGLVIVTGTKCAKFPVKVRGSSFWQSIDPPGVFIASGSGVADFPAGCNTKTFANPVPEAVQAAARRPDNPVRRWIITGTETPVRATTDGSTREGVPRAWATQVFEVVT